MTDVDQAPVKLVEVFNTHDLSDDAILALKSGEGREIIQAQIMEIVARNVKNAGNPMQHALVMAPRGFGKSFMTRLVEIETNKLAQKKIAVRLALLPEEQRNVHTPSDLLREIRRLLLDEDWFTVSPKWEDDDNVAWDSAAVELETALDRVFLPKKGLLVAAIENFDKLFNQQFKTEQQQTMLRAWMTRDRNRVMLLATATGAVDLDYGKPIFQAFETFKLEPWSEDDCIHYFARLRQYFDEPPLSYEQEAKARAIANFIGGNPRLARLLGHIITTREALTVAQTLKALVDKLADYYRRRIDDLSPRAAKLVDALIRLGEPCSQSELAERVGTTQSRIAAAFNELQRNQIVTGIRASTGRATLYRITDRVFVHFYRTRHGAMTREQSPLLAITDFLESFFSREEKRAEADRYLQEGMASEARVMAELAMQGLPEWTKWQRNYVATNRRFITYLDAFGIGAKAALRKAFGSVGAQPAKVIEESNKYISRGKRVERVLWHILAARAHCVLGLDVATDSSLAMALEAADGDADLLCVATHEKAIIAYYSLADEDAALAAFEQSGNYAEQTRIPMLTAVALSDQVYVFSCRGKYAESLQIGGLALEECYGVDDKYGQAWLLKWKAIALSGLQRHEEAVSTVQRAIDLAAQIGDKWGQADSLRIQGWNLGRLNRHEEAVKIAWRAVDLAAEINACRVQTLALRIRVNGLSHLQRYQDALIDIQNAIATATNASDSLEIAWSSVQLVQLAKHVPAAKAVQAFREALEIVSTQKMDRLPNLEYYLDDLCAAATRGHTWDQLINFWCDSKNWFEKNLPGNESSSIPRAIADVVLDIAKTEGRATAFKAIASMFNALGPVVRNDQDARFTSDQPTAIVFRVLNRLAQYCDNLGLLADIVDQLPETFPGRFESERTILEAVRKFHAADRNPSALERVDPDVAKAIQRVWSDRVDS